MTATYPEIDRAVFAHALSGMPLQDVIAAPEGRFVLPVPALADGKGPLLIPNVKELAARLRGSNGHVQAIELEAGPQKVPVDGTNVIIINRVDEFIQLSLKAKLQALVEAHGLTRETIFAFMDYARGYSYSPENQTIAFSKGAGFHNDVYNIPMAEFKKRYVEYKSQKPLDGTSDQDIPAGYYIKKPLHGRAAFIDGQFAVRVDRLAGDTVQQFENGAMIAIPDDPALSLSFIHPTDIDISYRRQDGKPLTIDKGAPQSLPVYNVELFLQAGAKRA